VHAASAGVDRLGFPALRTSDVTVTNSRGVFDAPMAEYVLGLVLALAKGLPTTLALQGRREWRHRESEQVAGSTAVVVGAGPIGMAIARMLAAVGMRTEVVGRGGGPGKHAFDELPSLLPLTDLTRGMLDAPALAALPRHARVVNVGRGALVVEPDLVDALREGRIAGAALDVVATEPLPSGSPLWALPNVIVSPHMSGDVVGFRTTLADLFATNLARYRAGEPLLNVVDKTLGYVPATVAAGTRGAP
jgi:phosphoglycerate dehydrogenase-like enzyme